MVAKLPKKKTTANRRQTTVKDKKAVSDVPDINLSPLPPPPPPLQSQPVTGQSPAPTDAGQSPAPTDAGQSPAPTDAGQSPAPTGAGFDPVTGASMSFGFGAKEREFIEQQDALQMEEIRKELEVSPEIKEAGVEAIHEEIELPEPLKKIGVEKVEEEPVINNNQAPVILPLVDDKIITSQSGSVWSAITWLALWCLKQLKKVHVKLKKVKGKIVRVKVK